MKVCKGRKYRASHKDLDCRIVYKKYFQTIISGQEFVISMTSIVAKGCFLDNKVFFHCLVHKDHKKIHGSRNVRKLELCMVNNSEKSKMFSC